MEMLESRQMAPEKGTVILNDLVDEDARKKVISFLARQSKNTSKKKIETFLEKTPVILKRNASLKAGQALVVLLNNLGASATFVPDTDKKDEKLNLPLGSGASSSDPDEADISPPAGKKGVKNNRSTRQLLNMIAESNKELWLILSMVAIAALVNYAVASQYLLLGLYTLPTVMSAYFFGRRHAVLTAFASILLVVIVVYFNTNLFTDKMAVQLHAGRWYHIWSWACILLVTAYTMGTLYKKNQDKLVELRQTYQGLMVILRHFISKDEYTENHCYRVSVYAPKIAAYLGLNDEYIEDIRSAALLHDLGKLEVSRRILYKAARLTSDEKSQMEHHVNTGFFEPIKGPLGRILPMILGHHDKFDGSGYRPVIGEDIPLGARVIAVADVYDALTSDRPYRKAMSPFEVKEIIIKGKQKEFDPQVVDAFVTAFDRRDLEVPSLII